jgi:hypothetical protein
LTTTVGRGGLTVSLRGEVDHPLLLGRAAEAYRTPTKVPAVDPRFGAPEYVVRQRITPMVNKYSVLAGHDGEHGLVAFVRQKRLKLREEIMFFADESQRRPLFRIKARKVLDLGSRYDVIDEHGGLVGVFGKSFIASLARSTWVVYDPRESVEMLRIQERSQAIAVLRRVWEILPWVGVVPFPLRYHFDVLGAGRVVASYDKITTFRDHYRLTLHEPPPVDVRVLLGVAVAMDALQSR